MGDQENETHSGEGTGPTLGDLDRSGSDTAIYSGVQLETDPDRIRAISAADAAHLPVMRDHRDAWDKMHSLGTDIQSFLAERITARLGGNAAMTVYSLSEQAAKTRDDAALFGYAAKLNRAGFDDIITEVERFHTRVQELEGELSAVDGDLSGIGLDRAKEDTIDQREELNQVRKGLDDELRAEMELANTAYQEAHHTGGYAPPRYGGAPEWTGPDPQIPPGWVGSDPGPGFHPTPPHADAPDRPVVIDDPDVIVDDGPGLGENPDVIVDDGPTLQNPAPGPAPAPAPVNPSPGVTPPPGSGITPLPPSLPPGNGAVRPITPPSGLRPITGPPAARPTPGLGTPPSGSAPVRGLTPGSPHSGGRGIPTGSKASRALLPNQRNATAARGGGGPGSTANRVGGGASARNAGRATTASRPGPRSTFTTPFGTSARTTVPPVIGSRTAPKPGETPATPRVRNAGKVFGERANKGGAARKPIPKKLGGMSLRQGSNRKLGSPQRWSNAPKSRDCGKTFQGKVFGSRAEPEKSLVPASQRHTEAANRAALAQWRASRVAASANELTVGLNRTVVPEVITPVRRDGRFRRSDVGPVFGPNGWENWRD